MLASRSILATNRALEHAHRACAVQSFLLLCCDAGAILFRGAVCRALWLEEANTVQKSPPREAANAKAFDQHSIGQASDHTGVSAKMIRHYEAIGLIPHASRASSGYRLYGDSEIQRLRLIRRARDLGFLVPQIRELLELCDERCSAQDLRRLARQYADVLASRIDDARMLQRTLETLGRPAGNHELADDLIRTDLDGEAR